MKFLGVTILQGVEFPIFLLIFAWALQQCSATALPVILLLHRQIKPFTTNRALSEPFQGLLPGDGALLPRATPGGGGGG